MRFFCCIQVHWIPDCKLLPFPCRLTLKGFPQSRFCLFRLYQYFKFIDIRIYFFLPFLKLEVNNTCRLISDLNLKCQNFGVGLLMYITLEIRIFMKSIYKQKIGCRLRQKWGSLCMLNITHQIYSPILPTRRKCHDIYFWHGQKRSRLKCL